MGILREELEVVFKDSAVMAERFPMAFPAEEIDSEKWKYDPPQYPS